MNTDGRFLMKAQNKTMKTITSSNWRPLPRALCTLLLAITALGAMPRSARAQLYVTTPANNVGEYNAITGAAINAQFITGLGAFGLALSGNDLFVANWNRNSVGEYDATTGAAINANFITGLNGPAGLALSGNDLFVANYGGHGGGTTVGEYDASTGAAINANFVSGLSGRERAGAEIGKPIGQNHSDACRGVKFMCSKGSADTSVTAAYYRDI